MDEISRHHLKPFQRQQILLTYSFKTFTTFFQPFYEINFLLEFERMLNFQTISVELAE